MNPRRLLLALVLGLILLLATFAVLMAFQVLVAGLGDELAARVLLWVAMACLILFIIDAVILLVVLGLRAANEEQRDADAGRRGG